MSDSTVGVRARLCLHGHVHRIPQGGECLPTKECPVRVTPDHTATAFFQDRPATSHTTINDLPKSSRVTLAKSKYSINCHFTHAAEVIVVQKLWAADDRVCLNPDLLRILMPAFLGGPVLMEVPSYVRQRDWTLRLEIPLFERHADQYHLKRAGRVRRRHWKPTISLHIWGYRLCGRAAMHSVALRRAVKSKPHSVLPVHYRACAELFEAWPLQTLHIPGMAMPARPVMESDHRSHNILLTAPLYLTQRIPEVALRNEHHGDLLGQSQPSMTDPGKVSEAVNAII